MDFKEALKIIDEFVENEHRGNVSAAARALGMNGPAFSRWVKRERVPNAEDLLKMLNTLGARIVPRCAEATREVAFVDARAVNAAPDTPEANPEDYLAVPLVSEAGAGPGIVPVGEFESWFLVYRNEPSIRTRSDLIAVRIAKNSTSMEPTLHPGDIVLVDRNDKNVSTPGGIWLVMEPDGSGKVKRVSMERDADLRITRIIFYSDNVRDNPPESYKLESDYDGDIARAIVGRVVWAWSDVTRK